MERVQTMNPFVKRDNYDKSTVFLYRTLTSLTWLLVVLLAIIYTIDDPSGAKTIQNQNEDHPTPFALNAFIVCLYWVILLLSQLGYICFLFSNDAELVVRAANVGSHFLVNNILVAIFILLWVHGHFWMAEIFLIINSLNLTSLYFRHSRMPFFAHLSVVAGPKAWNTVALFTNGAAMVNAQSLPARIVANVFIWSLLLYGNFFVAAFQDYVMGVAMVVLLTALAVQQFLIKAASLQTIFAFIILGILAVPTLLVIILRVLGKEVRFSGSNDDEEAGGERRPLLDDE